TPGTAGSTAGGRGTAAAVHLARGDEARVADATVSVRGAGLAVFVAVLFAALQPIVVVWIGNAGPLLAAVARIGARAAFGNAIVVRETVAAGDAQRVVFALAPLPFRVRGVRVGRAAVAGQLAALAAQTSAELT